MPWDCAPHLTPHLKPSEALELRVFRALMWSLAHPGRMVDLILEGPGLPSDPVMRGLAGVARTLLDLEVSFYTPSPSLRTALEGLGAVSAEPDEALYHFYPVVTEEDLARLARAPRGSMLEPERGATLVLHGRLGEGCTLAVSGPGVKGTLGVQVGGLPRAFWSLREQCVAYPLGWEVFLLSCQGQGCRVLGLPRSSHVEVVD